MFIAFEDETTPLHTEAVVVFTREVFHCTNPATTGVLASVLALDEAGTPACQSNESSKTPVPVIIEKIADLPAPPLASGSPASETVSAINELVAAEHLGDLLKLPITVSRARVLSLNVMSDKTPSLPSAVVPAVASVITFPDVAPDGPFLMAVPSSSESAVALAVGAYVPS